MTGKINSIFRKEQSGQVRIMPARLFSTIERFEELSYGTKKTVKFRSMNLTVLYNAEEETRTLTGVIPLPPEDSASASSATSACLKQN